MDEEGEAPGAPTSPGAADGGGTSHRAGTAGALFPPPLTYSLSAGAGPARPPIHGLRFA